MKIRRLAESSEDVLIAGAMRAVQMWLALLCLMVLSGQCLPLDPRQAAKDREKEMEDRLRERMQGLPKFPEFPGADREEYKRYWEEAVNNNPSEQEAEGRKGYISFDYYLQSQCVHKWVTDSNPTHNPTLMNHTIILLDQYPFHSIPKLLAQMMHQALFCRLENLHSS